jgi:hypothetical protein
MKKLVDASRLRRTRSPGCKVWHHVSCPGRPSLTSADQRGGKMGDHRFTITIKMSFRDEKGEIVDGWFNWDGGRDGIDSRIIKLIEDVRDRGFAKFDGRMAEYWAEQNKAEIERTERAELDRLKAKYPQQEEEKT